MKQKFLPVLVPLFALVALFAVVGFGFVQSEEKLDAPEVNKMVNGLGFETKIINSEVGKEKYEFTITRGGLDIPIAAEVSASKNFIWLTVFFGEAPKAAEASGVKMHTLLNWNFKVQPCQFYITDKGNLMLAIAIENRNVTPLIMKRWVEKLVDDAVRSQDAWKNGGK
jgi:hypothetical protein